MALSQSVQGPETPAVLNERHYSVAEVAAMWNLSKDVVRKYSGTNQVFSPSATLTRAGGAVTSRCESRRAF